MIYGGMQLAVSGRDNIKATSWIFGWRNNKPTVSDCPLMKSKRGEREKDFHYKRADPHHMHAISLGLFPSNLHTEKNRESFSQ